MEQPTTWVRVGLNGKKIRAGDPCGWRCFFRDDPIHEVPIKEIQIEGQATSHNWMTGTSPKADQNGLVGWFECFGICTIKDEVLYIILQEPLAH